MNSKHLRKTFVQQHDASDCGVACLLSIMRYHGGDASLDELRRMSGTHKQGTTLLGLYQAAGKLGFDADGKEGDLQRLKEISRPIILHVHTEEQRLHYVVCYGWQKNRFNIGDPAEGISEITEQELDMLWRSKTCLDLAPNSEFVSATLKKKDRRMWFWKLIRPDIVLLRFSIIIGIAVALLSMALSVFSQKLIDDILPSEQIEKLVGGIGLLLLLLLVRVGLSGLRQYFLIFQKRAFNVRIIDTFYSALLHLPKPFFDTRKIGELVARLNDTSRIQRVIGQVIGNAVIHVIVVMVSLGFLFYYDWENAVIATVGIPIFVMVYYRYNKKIVYAQREVMKAYALNESNYIATMQGITEIKNRNRQSFFKIMNQNVYGFFQNKIFSLGQINIRLGILSGVVGMLFIVGILGYSSYQVLLEHLTLGELMAILGIVGTLIPSVTNLALLAIPINEAKIAFDRMFEFMGLESEGTGTENIDKIESVTIQNASFRFPGRKELFKNITINIPSNSIVALVGESGSGKSTLGAVLQKHYHLDEGEILINGDVSLSEIKLGLWRKKIGVVPQEITLFNGTVIDNIVLGPEQNHQKVVDFIVEIGLDQFFKSFPQGYGTLLGEEGVNISGGQKQVLALVRALYHKPELLILDEPTSALDQRTENMILRLLYRLKGTTAILFITHRMHILRDISDEIYILDNNTILANGSHETLLRGQNPYSKFWSNLRSESSIWKIDLAQHNSGL